MHYLKKELFGLIQTDPSIFDFIQESALDGIWYWDLQNPETGWMNYRFWNTLGYNSKTIKKDGLTWQSFAHADDLANALKSLRKHLRDPNHSFDEVIRYYHKSGRTIWIRCRGIAIRKNKKPFRVLGLQTDITKQKEYENELQNRIKRYDHVIEGSDLGTWEWNVQTGEFIFNERLAEILGYKYSELQPSGIDTWLEFVHPDDLDKSNEQLLRHFAGAIPFYSVETRMKHRNGDWVWILDKGKVISWTKDKKPEWMTGSHQDITERKTNELLLLQYQELLSRSSEAAKIGVWEFDLVHNKMYWGAVTKDIHEVPADFEPNFKNGIEFYPKGENRRKIKEAVKQAIERGVNYDIELQIKTYNNTIKWVRSIGISEFQGGKCKKIYGLFQDIDEKNKILKELAFQEEKFRQTFEHAANGMAIVGVKGEWLQVNKSLCDMIGYTEEELLTLTFQDITHPEDLQKDLKLLHRLLSGKLDSYQMEKRYFHKKGNVVWVLLSVSLVRNDKGEPIHFVSQISDMSERKALMETVQDQNKRLLNFAHIVSHNLRSHSSNFGLMLDLMQMQVPEATNNQFYPLLVQASDNLKETIAHLNEITLIQTTTNEELPGLNLYEYVEKAIGNTRALAVDTKSRILNTVDKNLSVKGIPAYLESIVLNLLTNAIKYRSPKRNAKIVISAQPAKGFVVLVIQDNGLGIDMEKHGDKLFGMYKTFHEHADARGIGLFITKNQVEAMRGKIEVESKVNRGTTFKISLQCEED